MAVLVSVIGAGRVPADYRPAWLFIAACGLLAAGCAMVLRGGREPTKS